VTDRLHPLLVLLCLINLGFVHSTNAVDIPLLIPMWVLALASPWLRRLQGFLIYRAAWNCGVLIAFALLVQHATTSGMLHMLEDGLVLAVLCQVHLLNNVGEQQRPDLTFFNSFLIAFVTSFFAPDFWWSLLFIAHTLVFVPSLQVYVLTGSGYTIETADVRAAVRDSAPRTTIIVLATALVFVFWPRDFDRKGWLKEQLAMPRHLHAGMAERIDLDRQVKPFLSAKIALRIAPLDNNLSAVPTHWRARVFSEFDGRTWFPQDQSQLRSFTASDSPWVHEVGGPWRRDARGQPHTRLHVIQYDRSTTRLVTTLAAVRLTPEDLSGCMLQPNSFAGFGIIQTGGETTTPISYRLALAQPRPLPTLSEHARVHFTALPDRAVPQTAYELSEKIRRTLAESTDALAYANAASSWLQSNRRYGLPGSPGFASNLGEFLLGTATGHCEYFATTLALLLRCQGVPCRLVGGYYVHEQSQDGQAMIARGRDAHAWIEVLTRDGTWHTYDATPAADVRLTGRDGEGIWQATTAWMQRIWSQITGFDDTVRQDWLSGLLTLPIRHPWTVLAIILVIFGLRRRRRRRSRQPAVARFERALRKARLTLQPGETPREVLVRANNLNLSHEQLEGLQTAADEHERNRYR